jgi:uncharacterized protein YndB with AHSA1/START domain
MPTARRQRRLAAPPDRVWEVVTNPHHMPRWWPEVKRMEGVEPDRFTQVFMTKKGRAVRADHYVIEAEAPGSGPEAPGVFSWGQEIEGTPFERVLTEAVTEVQIQGDHGETLVTITQIQKLRGLSRTGGFMLRRATRRRLDEALDGLANVV